MLQHYGEIDLTKVPDTEGYVVADKDGRFGRRLWGLGAVNLLVGPNNAGKSRFMRTLFRVPDFTFRPCGYSKEAFEAAVTKLHNHVRDLLGHVKEGFGAIESLGMFTPFVNMDWFGEGKSPLDELQRRVRAVIANTDFTARGEAKGRLTEGEAKRIHEMLLPTLREVEQLLSPLAVSLGGEPRVYVPVLRGLRPFGDSQSNVYEQRTRDDYKLTEAMGRGAVIFTGLQVYNVLRDHLLGSRAERLLVKEYEDFLSREVFNGAPVEIRPHREADVVHVGVGHDDERPIYMLGDGLQTLVIVTFPAFVAEKRSLLFIEEPETHLHPGMQRRLLELFLRHERLSRHQFFVTTHSNHLLDMAADYSGCTTLLVRKGVSGDDKPARHVIRVVPTPDRLVLDELGVRASSVFLTNATIWVEGVSDRLYLREYLRKYLKNRKPDVAIREDTHFSFLEGGGSNIAHVDFGVPSAVDELGKKIIAARVCSRSFVVLDGDNEGKPRLEELKNALEGNLIVLKGKEIENLLPIEVLHAYLAKFPVNATLVSLDDYHEKKEGLGPVLDRKLQQNRFADGLTIKNKAGLCEFAIEFMRENPDLWDLTPEASLLCEALAKFVADANGMKA